MQFFRKFITDTFLKQQVYTTSIAIFLLGTIFSSLAANLFFNHIEEQQIKLFNIAANERFLVIQRKFQETKNTLEDIVGFYNSSDNISLLCPCLSCGKLHQISHGLSCSFLKHIFE
jgi:hypothetical protein